MEQRRVIAHDGRVDVSRIRRQVCMFVEERVRTMVEVASTLLAITERAGTSPLG
ncbi:MAG: hypothetical protein ABIR32_01540 [Ilumatobacteraceae bacterium]